MIPPGLTNQLQGNSYTCGIGPAQSGNANYRQSPAEVLREKTASILAEVYNLEAIAKDKVYRLIGAPGEYAQPKSDLEVKPFTPNAQTPLIPECSACLDAISNKMSEVRALLDQL